MRRSFSGGPQRVPYWGIMRPTRPKWRVWVAPARGSHHHANTASTALQKGRARRRAAGFLITTSRFFQLQHGSARWASSLMLDRFVESSIAGGRDGWVKRSASRVGSKAQKAEARWWPVRHGRFTYAGRREEVPEGWSAGPKAATCQWTPLGSGARGRTPLSPSTAGFLRALPPLNVNDEAEQGCGAGLHFTYSSG
jgi:hypothetical protein